MRRALLLVPLLLAWSAPVAAAKPVAAVLRCLKTAQVTKDLADAVASAGLAAPDRLSQADQDRVAEMVAACESDPARRADYARYLRAHLTHLVQAFALEAEGISPGLVDDVLDARRAELLASPDPSEELLDAVSDALARSGVKLRTIGDEGWYQLGGYIASQSAMLSTEAKLRR